MDLKIILSVISAIIMILAYMPYFKDILYKKTKPHAYSWLIWIITQSTAIVGMWYGGGRWGLASLIVGTILVGVVFILSFKYGTKNITKEDTLILILALCAIFVWWQLDEPIISLIMVTAIDVLAYVPTFRKSYMEPWNETLLTWFLFIVSDVLTILSLSQYNLMTAMYISAIASASILLLLFCLVRRNFIRKPKSFSRK